MRTAILFFALILVFLTPILAAQLVINPTTTLQAQTSNNTATAASFVTQTNGNIGGANVSKEDLHTLLYPGTTASIYAHVVTWFGAGSSHMNVGYSSTDPAQVRRQVEDMISRGIDGVVVDWYGPGNAIDEGTMLLMREAELHPGFTFFIMVDKGAIKWNSCSGCTPQQALIAQLQYIAQTYYPSPAYARRNGRPLVTNFDLDLNFTLDWSAITAAAPGNPLFIFQHAKGFTHPFSGGSYAWVMPATSDLGMSYLNDFYTAGLAVPAETGIGGVYKGFDDTLASWGANRIMSQQCGQTWLKTFDKINSMYNASTPLSAVQLVTWNDYEEGTEIESGIDNCVSLSGAMSGNLLTWKISGNENTIVRYVVYISLDGQSLMPLAQLAPGAQALDICSFNPPAGSYQLYVQAVAKPTLTNRISPAVSFNAQCATVAPGPGPAPAPAPTPAPSLSLALAPSSLSVAAGQSASSVLNLTAQSLPSGSSVSFSCSGLPAGAACQFAPANVTASTGASTSTLTISTSLRAGMAPSSSRRAPLYATWFLSLGAVGLVLGGGRRGRRLLQSALLAAVMAVLPSCGGPVKTQSQSQPAVSTSAATYSIVVTATSGSVQASTLATLTIR